MTERLALEYNHVLRGITKTCVFLGKKHVDNTGNARRQKTTFTSHRATTGFGSVGTHNNHQMIQLIHPVMPAASEAVWPQTVVVFLVIKVVGHTKLVKEPTQWSVMGTIIHLFCDLTSRTE